MGIPLASHVCLYFPAATALSGIYLMYFPAVIVSWYPVSFCDHWAPRKKKKKSYERDTFRKPAGETWLSDHAALESALAAAKEEAKSLRRAAEGQVSALEAGRLRGRAAKAEAALGEAIAERLEFEPFLVCCGLFCCCWFRLW